MNKLPKNFSLKYIKDEYDLPVHDQGNKNSCTSHAVASALEFMLSDRLKERVLVDADDLWEKQNKFGTATEEGDSIEGAWSIATKYGVKIKTDGGKTGIFSSNGIVWD